MNKHRNYAYMLEDVMQDKFKYGWDQEQLWKVAERKKIKKYSMKDVKHWVYVPCWSKKSCYLSIFQVLQQPNNFPDHMKRIKNADLKYPLIIAEDKYDKYGIILDGNHRFAKMVTENKRVVPVVYLSQRELDKLKINI